MSGQAGPSSSRGGPGRLAIPAVAATTIIGAFIYYTTRPKLSAVDQRRNRADSKRSAGLGGAGVGGNAMTGGNETGQVGTGTGTGPHEEGHKLHTSVPKEKLPSGGVGSGVGAGGTNTRAIELASKKDGQQQTVGSIGGGSAGSSSSAASDAPVNSGSEARSWSQAFQGLFGQGGASATDDPNLHGQHHQTKVASNLTTPPTKNPDGRQ